MSDSITDRIAAIIAKHQFRIDIDGDPDQVFYCACQYMCGDGEGYMLQMAAKEHPAHVAEVIVEELPAWDVLMSILDKTYPVSVFPTLPDDPDRDPGPRIVSLIRRINEIREAAG